MNYYNEIDPYCSDWLENLIHEKLIPEGVVDRRDIRLVRPDDLAGFSQCHFFSGVGGWPLALHMAGWPPDRPCWTGSCPCQPFSTAGKRKGFADDRHLWPVFRDLIAERSPSVVLGEQVASATEWLRLVRGDLEALGYAVGAIPIEAASAGADHLRDRFWFVADDQGERWGEGRSEHELRSRRDAAAGDGRTDLGHPDIEGPQGRLLHAERADQRAAGAAGVASALGDCDDQYPDKYALLRQGPQDSVETAGTSFEWVIGADGKARRVKSGVRLLAHGIPDRVAKLRAFGNAIDPRPASEFIMAAMSAFDEQRPRNA